MIFSMSKSSISCRDLKKIKNIKAKESKKCSYYSRNGYSSDSDSSFFRDSDWDKIIQPTELKDMNKLYHKMTSNINNKDQPNEAI